VVVVGNPGVGSVLRFADTPDEIVTDPGNAKGSLADAVERLWQEAAPVIDRTAPTAPAMPTAPATPVAPPARKRRTKKSPPK
ncbi:MAG: hypothetical protein ACKOAI_00060, partial [Acidimicrobiia bacterium]